MGIHTYHVGDREVLVHNACKPPNPYGRRGSPAHVDRIDEAETRLAARGWTTVAGGSLPERMYGSRFPDLVMQRGESTIAIQVGRATRRGLPIARERRAIADLRRTGAFDHVFFLKYVSMSEVLSPDEWRRADRGRAGEFPRVRAEDLPMVLSSLPEKFGPYLLIANELVRGPDGYVPNSHVVVPTELERLIEGGTWNYFIVSERVSPELVRRLPDVDGRTLAVNGAINLQIGRRTRAGTQPAAIGMVPKVATKQGQSRSHVEYSLIYEAAVRELKKSS
ncbi:hypothetical protein [Kribbella sp. NPDC050470]|uniref:hypothetical protein n=1 Tax=unclassified Kribbella TaxID=2644121 RepID=UPI003792116B